MIQANFKAAGENKTGFVVKIADVLSQCAAPAVESITTRILVPLHLGRFNDDKLKSSITNMGGHRKIETIHMELVILEVQSRRKLLRCWKEVEELKHRYSKQVLLNWFESS